MPDINANPLRFENGGVLEIIDGATTYTVLHLLPGSGYEITPPTRENITFTDRATQQHARVGDRTLGEIQIRCRLGRFEATDLYDLLMADGTGGLVKEYTLVFKWPDEGGGGAGVKLTCANVFADRTTVRLSAGQEFDEISATLYCRTTATQGTLP